MALYRLLPAGKDYLWGGTRLKEEYGKNIALTPLAETWEVSCHPDGPSTLPDLNGITLPQFLKEKPTAAGEAAERFPQFPILIKFIDAAKPLSVQVHPDDQYALAHEHQFGKTEMWYVVDALPGSFLYYGFTHKITPEQFKQSIADNTLCDLLHKAPVKKGDVFFIEAGTVHAIGAGILIAEIQQNSNVTYRVYDYGRVDADGKHRPLHIPQACAVANLQPAIPPVPAGGHIGICPYFAVDKYPVTGKTLIPMRSDSFTAIITVDGIGKIKSGDQTFSISQGNTLFAEAGSEDCIIEGNCVILTVFVPKGI